MKIVNTESPPPEIHLSTPTIGPSAIYIATVTHADLLGSSDAARSPKPTIVAADSRLLLTRASLLRMGQLALYVDRRAANLEASVPDIIRIALTDAVTPLSTTIDALAERIASTEVSMVFGTVETPDIPKVPLITTGHGDGREHIADPEPKAEIDEQIFEEVTADDITETEEIMINAIVRASLAKSPIAGSSGAGSSGGHFGY
uniref:Polyprotein protein n=1 Tax=Solanum tuberosum TaxID=4113 RepID=M1DTP3_SOLTU